MKMYKPGDIIAWKSHKNGVVLLILNVNLLEKSYTTVILNTNTFHTSREVPLSFDGASYYYVYLKDKKL